jgi:hypothetical protein
MPAAAAPSCCAPPARHAPHPRLLKARFEAEGFDHPLLLQGEGRKSELLARFRRLGNAVLVASQSFWEGVDVRGEALVSSSSSTSCPSRRPTIRCWRRASST